MSVRAKVRVTGRHEFTGVSKDAGIVQVTVHMQPVYDEGTNSQWSKYTPSGDLNLTITNPEAYKQFELGKAYFVDFSPAED
jgi:hypothetical protein